ncbi:histone H1-like [Zingiber officinale]|uniref:histone H1-like n=1 Tax=Zingiber officinale TaxID=94328 RepID=UPI001C4B65E4|nr:histone H1-like [Zingiber officinale]
MADVDVETAAPAEKKPGKEKKARAPKAAKEKKPKGSKSSAPAHPPYFQMIKEAILALNEKTGSSPHAIAKFMEEKHKGVLPDNFKKVLAVQLKNSTTKGKLVKVKASFKLSSSGKKDLKKVAKKPEKKLVVETKKPRETRKRKVPSEPATKKAPKTSKEKRAPAKKAKAPLVSPKPKQPKSIKSPAAKRARKAAA